MNDTRRKSVSFTVPLPAELNERVEREAVEQERSKSQQINWIVKKYYESVESFGGENFREKVNAAI